MIKCPNCGEVVSEEHMDLPTGLAQCPTCELPFELAKAAVDSELSDKIGGPGWEHAIPPGMSLAKTSNALVLTTRWSSSIGMQTGFIAVAMTVLTVFMLSFSPGIAVMTGLAALFSGYVTAAFMLNKTTVWVGKGKLGVEHAPLPWIGAREVDVKHLSQLYVKEFSTTHKGRKRVSYSVFAVLEGTAQPLLADFATPEAAQYIERAIEEQLGIMDRAMPGEHR